MICIVAIAKDELKFIDEWLLYHQLIGIDHVFLYDDEFGQPLCKHLANSDFVTVIPWYEKREQSILVRNQVKAYQHAFDNFLKPFEWVVFLDIDEFLVFKKHDNIQAFLSGFSNASAVSLNWHVFGHNGFFDDPEGLITANLTRRMLQPSKNIKSITRVGLISEIRVDHCKVTRGTRVDGNSKSYTQELYEGRTDSACIHHYQCRSFTRWMSRAERGDVNFNDQNAPDSEKWRLTHQSCLEKFVTSVAFDKNEYIDTYMLKFKQLLMEGSLALGTQNSTL